MTTPRVPAIQSVRLNGEQWAAALARWQSTAITIAAMLTASTTLSYPSIDEMRENYGITPIPTP